MYCRQKSTYVLYIHYKYSDLDIVHYYFALDVQMTAGTSRVHHVDSVIKVKPVLN